MNERRSPGGNQGLEHRVAECSTPAPTASSASAFLQASVAEQQEREQHGLRCLCDRCRAARAIKVAELGVEPSFAEIDMHDPAVVNLMRSGVQAIRKERSRVDLAAAAWYVVEALRGKPICPGNLG